MPEPAPGRIDGDAVERRQLGVLERPGEPDREEFLLGVEGARSDQQRVAGHPGRVGNGNLGPRRTEIDHCRPVGHVGHDLEPGPQARIARQGDGVETEAHHVGHRAGRQQRDMQACGHGDRGAGEGGRLSGRVVTDQGHGAAERLGAGVVAVTDGVGRPVEPGILAVPERRHAVVVMPGDLGEELGARHRRGGQFLVEARREDHAVLVQVGLGAAQLQIEPAQRRPLVPADKGGRVEAPGPVQSALLEHESHHGLDARHQGAAPGGAVDVIEAHVVPVGTRCVDGAWRPPGHGLPAGHGRAHGLMRSGLMGSWAQGVSWLRSEGRSGAPAGATRCPRPRPGGSAPSARIAPTWRPHGRRWPATSLRVCPGPRRRAGRGCG